MVYVEKKLKNTYMILKLIFNFSCPFAEMCVNVNMFYVNLTLCTMY